MNLLSILFPPSLRSLGKLHVFDREGFDEQGSCGNVRPRPYANGIERTFAIMEAEALYYSEVA